MFMAGAAYQPGDTLVIRAFSSPWDYIYLGGIKGIAGKPVVVINEGVVEFKKGRGDKTFISVNAVEATA